LITWPRRVVALGGGTGLPAVLRGMRRLVAEGHVHRLVAVVAMSDDGGSSGRLRRSYGVPPPGDVRNCLVALAEEEDLLAGLFQHRYGGGSELGGHNLGNLILAALAERTGSFLKAVEVSSRVLRTTGAILPVTLEDVTLEAFLEDGTRVLGETEIGRCRKRIERIVLKPAVAPPTPGVVEAIEAADLVVLGPGSLFTSVLPTLVLDEVALALRRTRAARVLVANLVSERGEAAGLSLHDHVEVIESHAGGHVIDALLVHQGAVDPGIAERYAAEGVAPLDLSGTAGRALIRRDLLAPGPKLRHEPCATADGLVEAWRQLAERA
jgi:uncharacterized cofD-like protein